MITSSLSWLIWRILEFNSKLLVSWIKSAWSLNLSFKSISFCMTSEDFEEESKSFKFSSKLVIQIQFETSNSKKYITFSPVKDKGWISLHEPFPSGPSYSNREVGFIKSGLASTFECNWVKSDRACGIKNCPSIFPLIWSTWSEEWVDMT